MSRWPRSLLRLLGESWRDDVVPGTTFALHHALTYAQGFLRYTGLRYDNSSARRYFSNELGLIRYERTFCLPVVICFPTFMCLSLSRMLSLPARICQRMQAHPARFFESAMVFASCSPGQHRSAEVPRLKSKNQEVLGDIRADLSFVFQGWIRPRQREARKLLDM